MLGLRALLALHDAELDPLILLEAAAAARVDGRIVDEDVSAAAVRQMGPKPFSLITAYRWVQRLALTGRRTVIT